VPLLYGDVAFDRVRGGTIVSTEQVLAFVARQLPPQWLLLAGDTEGVLDRGRALSSPHIHPGQLRGDCSRFSAAAAAPTSPAAWPARCAPC
jgi:isopentenyl phosphate kinase